MTTLDASAVEALGWALVHFAWQGALAAGVFAVLNLAAHGAGARLRYGLAAATLAAMALMPPLTVLITRGIAARELARPADRRRGRPAAGSGDARRARRRPMIAARPRCARASRTRCPGSWPSGVPASSSSPSGTWAAGASSSG